MATPSRSHDEPTNQRIVRAFRSHYETLVKAIDPGEAALSLYQEKLISKTTLDEATGNGTRFKRSIKVVEAVETYLGICGNSPTTAHLILTILERSSTSSGLDSVIARIRQQAMIFGGSSEDMENYSAESPRGPRPKQMNLTVEKRMGNEFSLLKGRFVTMMMVAKRLLVQKDVDISELKERLLIYYHEEISRDKLSAANSIEEIFKDIILPRCTVTNYFLLSSLADELDIPGITEAIKKFERKEEEFNTCLLEEDFAVELRAEIERHESSDSELPRTEIKLKVNWAMHKATLTEFRSLVQEVFPRLYRWIDLEMVKKGCVCFTCFAPARLKGVLLQMAIEQQKVAMKKRVILLEVGGIVIFDITTTTSQQVDDSTVSLIGDYRFQEGVETIRSLDFEIQRWLIARECTIDKLKYLKKLIEESYQKRTISKVAGASAAVVGGGLGIVGFGLSFVTFGASLVLLVPGAILGGAGAVTMAGADIGDWLVSKGHMETAKKAIEQDRKSLSTLREHAEVVTRNVEELAKDYPSFPKEDIFERILSSAFKDNQAAYDGYRIAHGTTNVGRVIFQTGGYATGARIALASLNTLSGGLSIAGVVFNSVAIPFDLFVIIKGSIDIHKYSTGQGSNSNKANQLALTIEELEKQRDTIKCELGIE